MSSKRPMAVVKEMDGKQDPGLPCIIRKGRNTLATVCKDAPNKRFIDNVIDTFHQQVKASKTTRMTSLGYMCKRICFVFQISADRMLSCVMLNY